MSGSSAAGDGQALRINAGLARRDWLTLLLATLLVQGAMILSYPLGAVNFDDNQAAQAYMLGELAEGNPLIGNVRYNTGYAFVMSPVWNLTRALGRLGDRAFLLLQVAAYSAIPFMVYDMLRRRFDRRCALITALVALLDPFGLQWAHLLLPGWLIALTLVGALWLAQLAWSASPRRRLALIAIAAIGLGIMSLARLNFAPLAAVFGLSLFFWRHVPLRQRFTLFALVGALSGSILGAYTLLIHLPSTGVTSLSCISAFRSVQSLHEKGLYPSASNGPRSAEYARLLALPSENPRDDYLDSAKFALWRIPDSWLGDAERQAFLAGQPGAISQDIATDFPADLYWYLGPCAVDSLLAGLLWEALAAQPGRFLSGVISTTASSLLQNPAEARFDYMYLDRYEAMTWSGENRLGFQAAESKQYNGHRLWRPGAALFSALFTPWNAIKFITPLALIAALWRRDWLLTCVGALLLTCLILLAAFSGIEPRYYAIVAPLYSILIGSFLGQVAGRLLPDLGSRP